MSSPSLAHFLSCTPMAHIVEMAVCLSLGPSSSFTLTHIASLAVVCAYVLSTLIAHRRYLLSQHPEEEAKVLAELDEAGLLATRQRPNPRALEYGDLNKLTYLQAVLKVRAAIHTGLARLQRW
jgi:hypothetical protein